MSLPMRGMAGSGPAMTQRSCVFLNGSGRLWTNGERHKSRMKGSYSDIVNSRESRRSLSTVVAGLVPAIHAERRQDAPAADNTQCFQ